MAKLKIYKTCNAGGGFRTHDLQIMSIAFYGRTVRVYHSNWHSNQAELPRHEFYLGIWQLNVKINNVLRHSAMTHFLI